MTQHIHRPIISEQDIQKYKSLALACRAGFDSKEVFLGDAFLTALHQRDILLEALQDLLAVIPQYDTRGMGLDYVDSVNSAKTAIQIAKGK